MLASLPIFDSRTPRPQELEMWVLSIIRMELSGHTWESAIKVTKEKKKSPAEGPFLVICQKALKEKLSGQGLKGGGSFQVCQ